MPSAMFDPNYAFDCVGVQLYLTLCWNKTLLDTDCALYCFEPQLCLILYYVEPLQLCLILTMPLTMLDP